MIHFKKYLLLIIVLSIFCNLQIFSEEIIINKEEIKKDNIFLLSKNLTLEGNINGSIFAVGGEIIINGHVSEDIVCIGSDIKIGESAKVGGNLIVFGGSIEKNNMAVITGDFFYTKLNLKKIESTILPVLIDKTHNISVFRIIKLILWIILALIVFTAFSEKLIKAKEILKTNIFKVILFGLITITTFVILLMIFIILSFFFIGIPFTIALVIIFIALIMFGRSVLFMYIGTLIGNKVFKKKISPVASIVIGGFFYAILKFIPFVSELTLILNIIEIGAAVLFFMKNRIKLKSN